MRLSRNFGNTRLRRILLLLIDAVCKSFVLLNNARFVAGCQSRTALNEFDGLLDFCASRAGSFLCLFLDPRRKRLKHKPNWLMVRRARLPPQAGLFFGFQKWKMAQREKPNPLLQGNIAA
jgi:hypothetical protein